MQYISIFITALFFFFASITTTVQSEELSKNSLELKWIKTMRLAPGSGVSIDFSSDGDTFAYVRDDGSIWFWSLSQKKDIFCFDEMIADVASIVFFPDGTTIASGSGDSVNKTWSLKSRKMLQDFQRERWIPRAESVGRIAISPDSKTLACPGTRSRKCPIELWEVETGELIKTVGDDEGYWAYCLTFSPDGKTLTAVVKNEILQWSVETGEKLNTNFPNVDKISSLEYSPAGELVVAGGSNVLGIITFFNPVTGEKIRSITGHNHRVTTFVFSPDGRYLLTGSMDKSFKLWSVKTGELLLTHTAHKVSLIAVAFGYDNKTFATASSDGVIILWSIE